MKATDFLLPTEKEDPADAVVASHRLMIRAGLVRKSGSGLYHILPMGLRVLKKIEEIVREEMNRAGALEFELPILTPSEFWEESGRWEKMGKEMFRLKDRHDQSFALGPTHEESFTLLMKGIIKSYKDLPVNVYQIHVKFRDEIRPRFGVIRSREFRMKDAYSFHLDQNSLDETYEKMRVAYRRIFERCGLKTIPVQADSGAMGGAGSEEFMVPSHIGEETLTICPDCGYAGNVEKTPVIHKEKSYSVEGGSDKIHTPGMKTIQELSASLSMQPDSFLKAVIMVGDESRIAVLFMEGDRDLNEVKLKNLLKATELRPANQNEILKSGTVPGYTGPGDHFQKDITVYFDAGVNSSKPYVIGGGETDYHIRNYILKRDFSGEMKKVDLSLAKEGDFCPNCEKPMTIEKGIEVGHIFKLGDKYTKAFKLTVTDKSGKNVVPTMGCYGIGITRTIATVIEQSHDDKGIIWPVEIAPFTVSLVSIAKNKEEEEPALQIYEILKKEGVEVFWDNRSESPGFKLRDAEIVGFPLRITVGKKYFTDKIISLYNRALNHEEEHKDLGFDELAKIVKEKLTVLKCKQTHGQQ